MTLNLCAAAAALACAAACAAFPAMAQNYDSFPAYIGEDLELTVTPQATKWRHWSPEAQEARVLIYNTDRNSLPTDTLAMARAEQGTWTAAVNRPLYGKFYTFQIKHNGRWLAETPGVWAKAVGTNGQRAAIIDLAATNPEGWEADHGPKTPSPTDAIVYEMHHRDLSISPTSGIVNKGKFLGLTEAGTHNATGEATGLDHIKELGVTHVQILPSYDYASVDESNLPSNTYNWGYDPLNYNAPEGSYSTNPEAPDARIREMKKMIKTLHDNGIGVIMDVVYNHTFTGEGSNFSLTAPGYYYRHRPDGSYSDASGCGNETASEREQMRNFIVNSVKYWAKEFHIDGFRFDLMAIHDIETMNAVAAALKEINPNIIIYGEGWTAGDSPLPAERRALKDNAHLMPGVGVFSDDLRDAVKGHYSNAADRGFATGKPGLEETVKIGIVGATAHPQVDYSKGNNSKAPYTKSPAQVVNYVSCHDDLMLTDKLRKSMTAPGETDADRMRAARLAQTIVLTSQGIPFIWAGEEMWRDKKGVHNSYKSPDSINAIDWNNKHFYPEQVEYYRQLIALRKAHPAFRMSDADMLAKHLKFDRVAEPNLVSYSLTDYANGDSWKEIKVIFNGSDAPKTVNIPKGKWLVIADDGALQADGLRAADGSVRTLKGGKVTAAPRAALILARE